MLPEEIRPPDVNRQHVDRFVPRHLDHLEDRSAGLG
jgi:hypothetical protein